MDDIVKRVAAVALLLALLGVAACGDDEPAPPPFVPPWAKVAPEQIAEAKKHGVPVAFENDLGMRFVLIPAGTFLMGSPEDEEGRGEDETQNEVTLTKPYYMQITEVTNRQFEHFRPEHRLLRYGTKRDDDPVTGVSYEVGASFAQWLSEREEGGGLCRYRLPTEQEWMSCCSRSGADPWLDDESKLGEYANVPDLSDSKRWGNLVFPTNDGFPALTPVASFKPNAAGFHDLIGNVSEWCSDLWDGTGEPTAIGRRLFPDIHRYRVIRGSNWHVTGGLPDCSARMRGGESKGYPGLVGFRLVVERVAVSPETNGGGKR